MKRIYSFILAFAMLIPLVSCTGTGESTTTLVNVTDEITISEDDLDTSPDQTDSITENETDQVTDIQTQTQPEETYPPVEQPEPARRPVAVQ